MAVAIMMRKCQPLLAGGGSCTSFNNIEDLERLVGLVPVLLHMRGSEKNSICRNIEVGILVGILYIVMIGPSLPAMSKSVIAKHVWLDHEIL